MADGARFINRSHGGVCGSHGHEYAGVADYQRDGLVRFGVDPGSISFIVSEWDLEGGVCVGRNEGAEGLPPISAVAAPDPRGKSIRW